MVLKCNRVQHQKYNLELVSSTILEAMCKIAHDQDESSEAFCIRHHPHDLTVELCMDLNKLPSIIKEFGLRINSFSVTSGASDMVCHVDCPTFWVANIVRRTLWTSISVVACTSVCILTNTSKFADAMIAHRCGQLAIQGNVPKSDGVIDVKGRNVLGKDIIFDSDLRVAPTDANAPIVYLAPDEEFAARLHFSEGIPLQHAKFHSVAAPSYHARVTLQREVSEQERDILSRNGCTIDANLVCHRRDNKPCRPEYIKELIPGLEVHIGPNVRLGVESLGQIPAVECVRRALDILRKDTREIVNCLIECERIDAFDDLVAACDCL